MRTDDAFCELAPYYDKIMDHVNYDRWQMITMALSSLLSARFRHLDAACGTGTLIKRLRTEGWNSVGVDLSFSMVRAGRKGRGSFPGSVGDLRALPFSHGIDYVTCLFDSINFLLSIEDVTRAFRGMREAFSHQGLLYFDIVTERMVTEHFEGKEWTEDNGRFSSAWSSRYSRKTSIAETRVRVNSGPQGTVFERIYSQAEIERALKDAGLCVLGAFDAHTWKAPHKKTVRIDFVASVDSSRAFRKRFDCVCADIRKQIG